MVKLAYLLGFDGRATSDKLPTLKPGRGAAGWTVGTFASAADRVAFMAAHPESCMPCWGRIERGEVA